MADFEELVRSEAYRIWEGEGCPDGQHDRHWQMAAERVKAATPQRVEAPVVPLPLKRVALSARRGKPRPSVAAELRASA